MNNLTFSAYLQQIQKKAVKEALIPLNFCAGLPLIKFINSKIFIVIPFYRFNYVKSDKNNESLIFPIKFAITTHWPTGRIIAMNDLEFCKEFENVDYCKNVGTFKHEAIQHLSGKQYKEQRERLYTYYDKILGYIVGKNELTQEDEMKFKMLLNTLIEPSLVDQYITLAPDFADKYLDCKGSENHE